MVKNINVSRYELFAVKKRSFTLKQGIFTLAAKLRGETEINMSERVTKHNYYLDIAETVSERATCMRRHFGAIIVKDDVIVSTGYNGAPRGRKNCTDINFCIRDKLNIPRGERYEMCRSVHAEANAIIAAPRDRMLGATLYMVCVNPKDGSLYEGTSSCMMCKRQIINAGIETVIVRDTKDEYRIIPVQSWIDDDDSLSGQFGY
jgi:dCMP deaminase